MHVCVFTNTFQKLFYSLLLAHVHLQLETLNIGAERIGYDKILYTFFFKL